LGRAEPQTARKRTFWPWRGHRKARPIHDKSGAKLLLLILRGLLMAGLVGAAVLIFLLVVATRKKPSSAPPTSSTPLGQQGDLEQQLRTLARLKQDGLITEDDFNAKKKALLGL
jgi:hypothetical protein